MTEPDRQHNKEMARPIDELDLTTRSWNCLQKSGIHTIGDLVAQTEEDLLSIRNFGEYSLCEILEVIGQRGLSLHPSRPMPPPLSKLEIYAQDPRVGPRDSQRMDQIVKFLNAGETLSAIARYFGIAVPAVRQLKRRHGYLYELHVKCRKCGKELPQYIAERYCYHLKCWPWKE